MTSLRRKNDLLAIAALALFTAGACAGSTGGDTPDLPEPQPGHAFLTIVGDRNVFLEGGARQTLTVKYHDETGAALAGEVRFRIEGTPAGSNISTDSDVTNQDGLAKVDVLAAQASAASFRVIAEAEYATPVDWRIAVNEGEPPLPPLSVAGTYRLESQFDMVDGLPGTVGTVVNGFIDMTDDPNDPATWLIDLALDQIDSSTIRGAINSLRPGLDAFLNGILLDYAPGFVVTLIDLGDAFGQIAHRMGTVSELRIAEGGADGSELTAKHSMTGIVYKIDGVEYEYTMAELDLGVVEADGIQCTLEGENLVTIGDHSLPVSYGRVLLFGLNNVIIPIIDPWSDSLADLFIYFVDCYNVGYELADYIGIGSSGFYESVCETALTAGAAYLEDQITSLEGTATSLNIHGDARPNDSNNDRKVDRLQNGLWEGEMTFGSIASTLAKPDQKFVGERMGVD